MVLSKGQKSTSKYLTQTASSSESNHLDSTLNNSDDAYVKSQHFKSKEAKKEDQEFHVSKINKPAKYTEDGNFIQKLLYRIAKDDASGMSAQLAYYFLLSLFPLLIFLLTLIPLFNIEQSQITEAINNNAPGDTATLITGVVEDVMSNSSGGLLSFGLIAALWSASNGMTALMNAFNVAYEVEDSRNFFVAKGLSILFTIIMVLVFATALALPVFGGQIGNYLFGTVGLEQQFKWIFNLVQVALPVIITFIVFSALYTLAPHVKISWKSVLPGALFATVVWLGASFLFGIYVNNFSNYSKTYGSIGGIIVLMLWLYLTGFIIIIGAQINAIIRHNKDRKQV